MLFFLKSLNQSKRREIKYWVGHLFMKYLGRKANMETNIENNDHQDYTIFHFTNATKQEDYEQ